MAIIVGSEQIESLHLELYATNAERETALVTALSKQDLVELITHGHPYLDALSEVLGNNTAEAMRRVTRVIIQETKLPPGKFTLITTHSVRRGGPTSTRTVPLKML